LVLKDKAGHLASAATSEIKATKEALGCQELMEKLAEKVTADLLALMENMAVMEYPDCLAFLDLLGREDQLDQLEKEAMKELRDHKDRLGRKEKKERPVAKDNMDFLAHLDIKDLSDLEAMMGKKANLGHVGNRVFQELLGQLVKQEKMDKREAKVLLVILDHEERKEGLVFRVKSAAKEMTEKWARKDTKDTSETPEEKETRVRMDTQDSEVQWVPRVMLGDPLHSTGNVSFDRRAYK
jgi:hypothetical protein